MYKYSTKVKGLVNGKWKTLAVSDGRYNSQAMEYSARVFQEMNKGSKCFLLFDLPNGRCTAYTILIADMSKPPRNAA